MRTWLAVLLAWSVCASAADAPQASLPGQPDAAADAMARQVQDVVNRHRAWAGLPPVVLDATLSRGCMAHAHYMRLNQGTDAMAGLNAHQQRPELPGASPEGARCAQAADLALGVADPTIAVDSWMASLYHRRPILDPGLGRVGVGYARLANGGYMVALMFQDGRARGADALWPVPYPADQQVDVPLEFGGEIPNPIPGGGGGGFPITLQFPPFDRVTDVSASLVDAAGAPVPFHLSHPERPATSFGQYGVVCLIPERALLPATTYRVKLSAAWRGRVIDLDWRFSTVALRLVDALDESALNSAINVASRVRGKVLHGGLLDARTAFLQLGERGAKRDRLLSVLMPQAVWLALGGSIGRLVGRPVEVDGTPRLVGDRYINIPISTMDQLRLTD